MKYTEELQEVISRAADFAGRENHRYLMPEHLVYAMTECGNFARTFTQNGGDITVLKQELGEWLSENAEARDENQEGLAMTEDFGRILLMAEEQARVSGRNAVELSHVLSEILALTDSYAVYFLTVQDVDPVELLGDLSRGSIRVDRSMTGESGEDLEYEEYGRRITRSAGEDGEKAGEAADADDAVHAGKAAHAGDSASGKPELTKYLECMNETCREANPLIGREKELKRTIQILCRKDKNNVMHIGEPGVGKTAIAYGLARRIESQEVPEALKNARLYSMDLGALLAGTQFRGDFEKRFQMIMDELKKEEKPILYLDEIHNIVGAGAVNGSSFDISNMLKPYLAAGKIRFIGATTYEEYKKHLSLNKGLVRRFQIVDIGEPTETEAVEIVNGLKPGYEKFHGVKYADGVVEYAVAMSKKYVNERFLPDKAIDLIDEAGAARKLNPLNQKVQTVRKPLIDEILSQTCQIPKQTIEKNDAARLAVLEKHLKQCVFGQEEAIGQISNAVKFSKAGLNEDGKPLASFLFVGPTGVGKTESAKALADELGIHLIRFDMSEYTEKHAVAKLIGAPAGYVGYEEGGLLTEEIHKHPNAVLLLDEIEKAHPDIYNILLQVMDYATLTDNQGRRADFRNIILIMTSNAGAGMVGKQKIGFGNGNMDTEAMEEAVKNTFQPEFRNRLSRIVIFNGMDEKMAARITDKKLAALQNTLTAKKVDLKVTKEAKEWIKNKGITKEYGAREIDRVIASEVKPLLVSELLFGKLKKGGACLLFKSDGKLQLRIEKEK